MLFWITKDPVFVNSLAPLGSDVATKSLFLAVNFERILNIPSPRNNLSDCHRNRALHNDNSLVYLAIHRDIAFHQAISFLIMKVAMKKVTKKKMTRAVTSG